MLGNQERTGCFGKGDLGLGMWGDVGLGTRDYMGRYWPEDTVGTWCDTGGQDCVWSQQRHWSAAVTGDMGHGVTQAVDRWLGTRSGVEGCGRGVTQ